MSAFIKITISLFIFLNSHGCNPKSEFGMIESTFCAVQSTVENTPTISATVPFLKIYQSNYKEINPTYNFLSQLILVLFIFILLGVILILVRRNGLKKKVYKKRIDSLRNAQQRILDRNKTLEDKIKSRTEEVIEHISQHDEILNKLSQSEVRFEKIFSNNSDALAIIDYETLAIVEINQAAIDIFNLTLPEKRPFHFSQFTSDGSSYILYKIASIVKYHQQITDYVISENRSKNNQKWFSITSQIIKFNEFQYYLISAKNITKRMKAELLLIENEKRLTMLTENINDMIWLLNETLQITYISPSISLNLGFQPNEVLNRSISILLSPQSHHRFKEITSGINLTSSIQNDISLELEFIDKAGQVHLGEFKAQIHRSGTNSWYIYGVSRDITEKKKTEIALKQSEQLYRLITNNVNDVIFTSSTSLKLKYVNQAVHSFLGYTPEELYNIPLEEYFSRESLELVNTELKNYFNKISPADSFENKLVFDSEIDFIAKDGTSKWGNVQINLLLDEKNYIYGLIGTIHDNTQKHQIELIESNTNNFFKKLFYESPVMMLIVDKNGLLENINNAFIEKTGYTLENITKTDLANLIIGNNGEFAKVIHNKESSFAKLKSKMGNNIDILYDIEQMGMEAEPEKYLFVMRDITNQMEAETIANNKQEQFKALSDHSPDIIARYNNNIECTYVNSTIEKEFGLIPDSVIGKRVDHLGLGARESKFLNESFVQVFIDGTEKVVDFSIVLNDQTKHYQARIIPEFSGQNHVQTIMVVTRNMTEYINAIMMLHTNVQEMTFLNKAIIYCNQSKTKSELYQNILMLIIHEFGFSSGEIYEYNVDKKVAHLVVEHSFNKSSNSTVSMIDSSHPIYEDLFINRQQILLSESEGLVNAWIGDSNIKTILVMPISSNEKMIGALSLKSDKLIEITDSMNDIIRTVSQELGSSIDRIEAISMHLDSEENYRSLVEATTDLVWKVNETLLYSFVNDKSLDLLGYKPQEMLGTSIISTIKIEEHLKIKKFLELNKTLLEKFTFVDVPLIKKSGQIVHVEINGYPLIDRNGKFIGYAGINRDISIRKINEDLRQRKEIAERMAEMKQQFLSNISHELRTPLTAIIGHTEIISKKVNDGEICSHIRTIETNSKSLLHIISDILDLAKIESGKLQLQLEPINVVKFFEDLNLMFTPLARAKNLNFDIEISSLIQGNILIDELRLQQILNNLVGNAIKFTDQGMVKVVANLIQSKNSKKTIDIIISIADTGIGIEETQLLTIFDTFTQADGQSNKKYGGSGLGLSISKNLVELMNGSISIESKKGVGSTFTIIIPAVEISQQEAKNGPSQPTQISKQIGIIDSTLFLNQVISKIVTRTDCNITSISLRQVMDNILSEKSFDFIAVNLDELLSHPNFKEILNRITPYDRKTIYVTSKQKSDFKCSYLITSPIDQIFFHDMMTEILTKQTNNSYLQQIQSELTNWSHEDRIALLNDVQKQCSPLWEKAFSSNSIDQITKFKNALSVISKQYDIKFIKNYTEDIKIGLKIFDIEKIKQLLEIYPRIIDDLKKQ